MSGVLGRGICQGPEEILDGKKEIGDSYGRLFEINYESNTNESSLKSKSLFVITASRLFACLRQRIFAFASSVLRLIFWEFPFPGSRRAAFRLGSKSWGGEMQSAA